VRVEWSKAKARLERWTEEVALLREEQRRVLAFLNWLENTWTDRADGSHLVCIDLALSAGLQGYALKQASTWARTRARFKQLWRVG
jgi:hypothetical protein